jgi:CheY-like chemotaxis protein
VARTVLVADDSPTIQRRASGILTGEGLEVVTVSNGVAAIRKLSAVKPLVVLADVSMPGRDGYEVCQFIKQSADLKHVPVVLVFSDDEPYEESRGAQVGADGRIKKPFDSDELVKMVSRWAAKAEAVTVSPQVVAPPAPEPFAEPAEAEPLPQEEAAVEPAAESNVSVVPEGIAFEQFGQEEASFAPAVKEPISAVSPEPEVSAESFAGTSFAAEPPATNVAPQELHEAQPSYAAAEPELTEETLEAHEPEEDNVHAHPHQHGGFFHAPEEIAEPVLSDELETSALAAEPAPAAAEVPAPEAVTTEAEQALPPSPEALAASEQAPVVSPEPAIPAAPEPEIGATVPEPESSMAAAEAAPAPSGSESVAEPAIAAEPELVSPAPAEPAPTAANGEPASENPPTSAEPALAETPASLPAPARLDAGQIFAIVHRVVVKMSPPAMPGPVVEDIARRIADEIMDELNS